jgi:hypothetical protein
MRTQKRVCNIHLHIGKIFMCARAARYIKIEAIGTFAGLAAGHNSAAYVAKTALENAHAGSDHLHVFIVKVHS